MSFWKVWRALKMLEMLSAALEQLLPLFRALQISSVFHIATYARWRMNELLTTF